MRIKGKELSEETIAEACEAYGISFEKKFEPTIIGRTEIRIRYKAGDRAYPIAIQIPNSFITEKEYGLIEGRFNIHSVEEAKEIIKAIQSAIDYIETKT